MTEMVTCPVCRTGQPRRRGDPLCPGCAKAALEVPPGPTWALDSPVLRQVLASVNVPAVVAVVRAACGLSQRDLAEVAGWTPAVLSYYERGKRDAVFDIRTVLQFADAVGMPRAALLSLVLGDPDISISDSVGCWPAQKVSCPVNEARLRYWQACTEVLQERDRQVSGTSLLQASMLLRRQVSSPLPESASAGLRASAAGIAVYAGHAAIDAGHLDLAKSQLATARNLVSGKDDPLPAVGALLASSALQAELAATAGGRVHARRALLLARQAAEEARYEPVPQLHALIAIHQARAAALLGDAPVFDAAIKRAGRELNRHASDGTGPLPAWLRHVATMDITAAEAEGSVHLSRTCQAISLYRRALEAPACPRDRALHATGLAHALAASGDHAEAAAVALDVALPVIESGVISARCLDRLWQVAAEVGPIARQGELRERLYGARQSIPCRPERAPVTSAGTRSALASVPA